MKPGIVQRYAKASSEMRRFSPAGSLRMPYRPAHDLPFSPDSVVDENLQVICAPNLYVCDMSVMPFSSAANPVRTLVALALRLSRHLR